MGCDMHLHVEVQIDGTWHHYAAPGVERNYAFFELLAGVRARGAIEPISQPRGLPTDLSRITQLDADYWKLDGHSWTWMSSHDLVVVDERWNAYLEAQGLDAFEHNIEWGMLHRGYFFGNSYAGFRRYPEDYARRREWIQDVRWCFWFDN